MLGAVEGIEVATPAFSRFVVPIAVVILAALFWFQRHGTDRIGRAFGPIMMVWFFCIAALGVHGILMHPEVLRAVNPWYALRFFIDDRPPGAS